MEDSTFIQRLKKELPLWVQQGWVQPHAEYAILDSLLTEVEQKESTGIIPFTVIWVGVVLLSAGIITFFATQWGALAPLMKMQLLIGCQGALYLLSALVFLFDLLKKSFSLYQNTLGQTLVTLGVILFGVNIFLIANLYHIALHTPTGVLMWALMALFTAYLMHSQMMLIISILLTMLWTAMEMFDFQHSVHWTFLPVWFLFLYPIVKEQWESALKVALVGLFTWSLCIMALYVGDVFFIQIYFLICLAMFLFAEVLKTYSFTKIFAKTVQHFSCVFGSLSLFALTFATNITKERGLFFDIVPTFGYTETISAMLLVLCMMTWIAWRSTIVFNTTAFIWGQGWLFLALLIILLNTHLGSSVEQYKSLIAAAYNVLFFSGIGWIIYVGYKESDRVLINLGFLFLAAGILSRYFDSFWIYPNRTLFFIVGGVLLTFGSFIIEKQRRQLIRVIDRKITEES
jgi:uncharacterized membrane protein